MPIHPDTILPPLVSIIMTTYNRALLIGETIESIQKQTYKNWELLIIDDGSDDDTEAVITNIKDARIQFHKAGRIGISGVIKNIGLKKAGGNLIAFIDSDDLWHPEKIEKQVAALEAYPEAGFSLTGGYNFGEPDKPVEYFYKQKEGLRCDDLFLSIFQSEIAVFTQALLIRKECLSITGLFKEVKSFSDADFIINLARHFKGIVLYEPLLYRRIHENNYIHSTWVKSYVEGIALIQSYSKDSSLPEGVVRDAIFRTYINFGEEHLGYKERRKAVYKFLKAWMYKPFSIVPFKKTGKLVLSYFKTS